MLAGQRRQIELNEKTFSYLKWGESGPKVIAIHGGGQTAATWTLVAQKMAEVAQFIALDLRGHGESFREGVEEDLNIERLVADSIAFANSVETHGEQLPIVLVGHSLGGSIVSRAAASGEIKNLMGVIVIDCMEGLALKGLDHMRNFVSRFPESFSSERDAVNWALRSGILKSRTSAAISIPTQLYEKEGTWRWRLELRSTEKYWRTWFEGMTKSFLEARCPKVLFVTGNHQLDKELMVAHMQGKLQLQFVPKSGHVVQEDQPDHVIEILSRFLLRHKLTDHTPVGVQATLTPCC